MADAADYAYHPPDGVAFDAAIDPTMSRQPPNQDTETHDVVRDPMSRLGGLRGPYGPQEQGA